MSEGQIITLSIIILILGGYYLDKYSKKVLRKRRGLDNEIEIQKEKKADTKYLIAIIIIGIIATLPFHYVSYKGQFTIFPKNQFTFSNTIVTDEDIENLVKRYNDASVIEKQAINSEPLMRKLREEGIIIEKSIFDKDLK